MFNLVQNITHVTQLIILWLTYYLCTPVFTSCYYVIRLQEKLLLLDRQLYEDDLLRKDLLIERLLRERRVILRTAIELQAPSLGGTATGVM